jgi:uncharacterized cupin superfamily protein
MQKVPQLPAAPVFNAGGECCFTIPGNPVGKPRMTQRDKWAKRPAVLRYREWADRARAAYAGSTVCAESGSNVTAYFGSNVTARTGSSVTARTGSYVTAYFGSHVTAESGSMVTAESGSNVTARTGSSVTARTGSYVTAESGSMVTARTGSSVTARTGSYVTAESGSMVTAESGSVVHAESGSVVHAYSGSNVTAESGSTSPFSVSWCAWFAFPASYSKKKRDLLRGNPHRLKPDRDNIDKAILDSLFAQDCTVSDGTLTKRWDDGNGPRIEVRIT